MSIIHLVLLNCNDGENGLQKESEIQNVKYAHILKLAYLEVVMGLILFRDGYVHL